MDRASTLAAASLRLRWKRYKRSHKKMRTFRRADFVLVAYAKSGRTWLSVMITHLAHQRFGTPLDELVGSSDFQRNYPNLPQFFLTADNFAPPSMSEQALIELYKARKVILLVRDPRDIVVSLYYQLSKRSSALTQAVFEVPENLSEMSLFDFVRDGRAGLPRVIEWLNRWQRLIAEIPESVTLHYEHLRTDTPSGLAAVARLIGWDCSQAEIQAAVDFADFDKLKSLERRKFFQSGRMQPGDPGDPDSYKVRRGKVGGYREDFTPEQIAWMDELTAEHLSPALGYLSDREASRALSGG
jgi:Sulfotransferase domain